MPFLKHLKLLLKNTLITYGNSIIFKIGFAPAKYLFTRVQGVQTLSDKSNFDVTARKFGQISKAKVFSCSQMKNNLF